MKGKISITRFSSNTEPHHGIQIQIDDEISGVRLVEIVMTFEQFGDAISGYTNCEYELGSLIELAGKIRQHKSETIPVDGELYRLTDKDIDRILLDYEVDGWKAHRDDFKNHHNWWKNQVTVHFYRYVESE